MLFILIKRVITLLALASGLSIRVRALRTQAAQAVVKPLAEREVSSEPESLRALVKPVLAREGSLFAQAACSQAEAASSRSLSLRLSAALPVRETIADPMLPSCHVSVEVIRHGITPGRHLQDGASTSIGISLARLSYSHEGAG